MFTWKDAGLATQCCGRLMFLCAVDPDPEAQDKYQDEFNCFNCDKHPICVIVLESLDPHIPKKGGTTLGCD